jgi:phytoene dehydrogenase-like protein
MDEPHVIIVGGGLAGLSAGCYARASGFRTTIIEHNLALGGVCTAWPRGPYTIDGCIHWLTGGPFDRLYEELGIIPGVKRNVLHEWMTYRSASDGTSIRITRDLDALRRDLCALAPDDAREIERLIDGARTMGDLGPPIDHPPELASMREQLLQLWEMRHQAGTLLHFRAPLGTWTRERLRTPALRRLFQAILPEEAPAVFLCMVLGYLERGHLSRPAGGTAAFRDALIASYERAGGEARLHSTVDEILVHDDRAVGVRLADGTMIAADAVVSTSSMPETALRLLGGRYGADEVRRRMATWKLFDPIVLASFGVAAPLRGLPPLWVIDGIEPFDLGGATNERLYLRIANDDPALAPDGHAVVQAMLETSYDWWATRGSRYGAEKDAAAEVALTQIERFIPDLRAAVEVTDLSTPLTFWNKARSWRGAFEGWMPNREGIFGHVKKTLGNLRGFYMAGQWVEPGGGVPTAILSGRQATQLLCADASHTFRPPPDPSRT